MDVHLSMGRSLLKAETKQRTTCSLIDIIYDTKIIRGDLVVHVVPPCMGLPDHQRKGFHFDGKDSKEATFENMPRFERHGGPPGEDC